MNHALWAYVVQATELSLASHGNSLEAILPAHFGHSGHVVATTGKMRPKFTLTFPLNPFIETWRQCLLCARTANLLARDVIVAPLPSISTF